jgi:hypothetical protein
VRGAYRKLGIIGAAAALMSGSALRSPAMALGSATPEADRKLRRIFGFEAIQRHLQTQKSLVYRSRGAQAKPKRHRNMLVVSKRVRRKHRRAA